MIWLSARGIMLDIRKAARPPGRMWLFFAKSPRLTWSSMKSANGATLKINCKKTFYLIFFENWHKNIFKFRKKCQEFFIFIFLPDFTTFLFSNIYYLKKTVKKEKLLTLWKPQRQWCCDGKDAIHRLKFPPISHCKSVDYHLLDYNFRYPEISDIESNCNFTYFFVITVFDLPLDEVVLAHIIFLSLTKYPGKASEQAVSSITLRFVYCSVLSEAVEVAEVSVSALVDPMPVNWQLVPSIGKDSFRSIGITDIVSLLRGSSCSRISTHTSFDQDVRLPVIKIHKYIITVN